MSEQAYRMIVTRADGHWLADVPEVEGAHTYARSLSALDQAVREVIVLAAELPDEDIPGRVSRLAAAMSRSPAVPRIRRHGDAPSMLTHA